MNGWQMAQFLNSRDLRFRFLKSFTYLNSIEVRGRLGDRAANRADRVAESLSEENVPIVIDGQTQREVQGRS